MKTVLIIAHDYPPIYSAGAERPLKFTQYLPEFGYRPVILTTGRYGGLPDDAARQIYRANDLVHALFSFVRRPKVAAVPQTEQYRVATIPNQSFLGRVRDAIMIPDTKLGWFLPAVRRGLQVIAVEHPSIIFSSSPPETVHLVAGCLSRRAGLPWVADLRDGWARHSPNRALRERPLRQALELRLERGMMTQATAVVTTTPTITADLQERYPNKQAVITITNGFDRTDFAGVTRHRTDDGAFRLVYAGAFSLSSPDRTAEPFFAAIAALMEADPATRLRVQIIGPLTAEERDLWEKYGLTQVVTLVPPVPRNQVYQYLVDADALLLVQGRSTPGLIPSKLFDYIGAGRPILALTEGNVAEEIIRQYHLGKIAPPDDPKAIAAALDDLMSRQLAGATWPGFAAAQARFERRALTGELAALFDRLLEADERR